MFFFTLHKKMNLLEIIGYVASALVAISLSLNSVVKFRIINFLGSFLFSTYGFLIGAIPVGILNGLISVINMYYLYKIFSSKENFEILKVTHNNEYLYSFLKFYEKDILKYYPDFTKNIITESTYVYLILRNLKVSGIVIAEKESNKLKILIDYVIPEYRDYKNSKFLYKWLEKECLNNNIKYIETYPKTQAQEKYFKKINFYKKNGHYRREILK